ncbi:MULTISPECIES: IPExxxVDY family protein [Flavobacterium]|uniref:IPExxxVDY family protein n=1 Tax=Flavobacterium gawalongense TaxID=2594432 RepID=A0A553BTQ7_9FLAO|nr:IPExxxVDY family protein [Flavobacterium gawalongense]TRX02232.1 IPExxxVDY family protein [Flavobacterium gawalongense]TRX07461.1 IPExxxVDY family protein [Flavobacterium gawalongense]TRX11629.1 IPExxxVDY family protein [Flavobacterium gawalongense]TRX12368.1 IPExxxVDY family protein [Flavobacterium gawalongense]TRX30366.1 IPExxxVDY family protein [Flavobacterium gawalongense]
MAIHKLDLGEFDEIDYYLIAIHTSLEDYRLAFFINQLLPINLSKSKNEIQINIEEGETNFSRFYYYDNEKAITWNLIQNKNEVIQQKKGISQNLFSNVTMEVSTKVFLLPEFKKVDYFLKIENVEDTRSVSKIQTILNKIDSISTLYTVDINQIKSKNNLIF